MSGNDALTSHIEIGLSGTLKTKSSSASLKIDNL